jgi:MFS family permease
VTNKINKSEQFRAVLVLIATMCVIGFNALAGTGSLNGVDTGAVSDQYPTVLTPAGYAFSIWSLIYLGMVSFSIYQLLPAQIAKYAGVRTIYLISCVLNCAWLYAWHHYWIGVCVILLFALAGSLALINFKLAERDKGLDLVLAKAPFGLYFGWVTVASFVNLMVFLRYTEVQMSPTTWNIVAIAFVAIALVVGTLVRVTLRNFIYPLAVAWALTAIAIKQQGNTAVILAAAIAVILCLVLSLSFVMDLRHTRQ